jgi:hypothetical protein
MDCIDQSLLVHALVAVALIGAGSHLMKGDTRLNRNVGVLCFAVGYILLGVTAAGSDVRSLDMSSRRLMLGVGSSLALLAGILIMYYHYKNKLTEKIPDLASALVMIGSIGLVLTIAVNDDGCVRITKLVLAVLAFMALGAAKGRMLKAVASGSDARREMLLYAGSLLLPALVIAYKC